MKISDTINLMLSNDYKERFCAEYIQLVIRYKKLVKTLDDYENGTLDYELTCPISTYRRQLTVMTDYIAVLEARAVMENVELPEIN